MLVVQSCPALCDLIAHQAPLSREFVRQEYWCGLPFPSPGDLPNPGLKSASPVSPTSQAASLPLEPPGKRLWEDTQGECCVLLSLVHLHACLSFMWRFQKLCTDKIGVYCDFCNTTGSNSQVGETDYVSISSVWNWYGKYKQKAQNSEEGRPSGLGMREGILTGCWTWRYGHEHMRMS